MAFVAPPPGVSQPAGPPVATTVPPAAPTELTQLFQMVQLQMQQQQAQQAQQMQQHQAQQQQVADMLKVMMQMHYGNLLPVGGPVNGAAKGIDEKHFRRITWLASFALTFAVCMMAPV